MAFVALLLLKQAGNHILSFLYMRGEGMNIVHTSLNQFFATADKCLPMNSYTLLQCVTIWRSKL